jgi:hypothetical protein
MLPAFRLPSVLSSGGGAGGGVEQLLMRAIVEAIQDTGYTAVERASTADHTTILFRSGGASDGPASRAAHVTHSRRRRCVTVELPPGRTVHRSYQVCGRADVSRLAAALAATVQ